MEVKNLTIRIRVEVIDEGMTYAPNVISREESVTTSTIELLDVGDIVGLSASRLLSAVSRSVLAHNEKLEVIAVAKEGE